MFTPFVYAASVALLFHRSFVLATPLVARGHQVVWNPPITAPEAGDVWTVGSTQLVTWDTDEIPPSAIDNTGTLLLGYFDPDGEGENLDTYNPLADGFLLTDGCVRVQVPDVEPRDSYIVVLMGNSGNASPEFSIVNSYKSRKGHQSFHKASSQKISNGIDSQQFPPGFSTPPPDFPVSNSDTDPIDTEPFTDGTPASTLCEGRSSWSSVHNPTPGEGPDRHC